MQSEMKSYEPSVYTYFPSALQLFFLYQHTMKNSGVEAGTNMKALTHSLILAVHVCYHARLNERTQYEEGIVREFSPPLALIGGVEQFRNVIIG